MMQSKTCEEPQVQRIDDEMNGELTQILKFTYLYLLVRFKLNYRQISIVTHTDFDGAISAAIVLQKFPYARLYFSSSRNLYKVLWVVKGKSSLNIPHSIYILDLRVDEHFRTRLIKSITGIRKEALIDIYWIDHHRSVHLDEMKEYVELFVDPHIPHAAFLVSNLINSNPKTQMFLDILQGAQTPFANYWRAVLKITLRSIHRYDLRTSVMKSMATFEKTSLTNGLFERQQRWVARGPRTVEKIHETAQGFNFGLIQFDGDDELYPKVAEILNSHRLDFLLVEFENGSFSAYKHRGSEIDLTPLLTLVGGKGHAYAFNFQPQERITDEFYRELPTRDLLTKVKEVL